MWNIKIFFSLLLCVVLTIIKTDANSACEQKEKHLAILDLAKDAISKGKELNPNCVNDGNDIPEDGSECGAKDKASAFFDVAMSLIEEAKKNYTACDAKKDNTDVVPSKNPMDCFEILKKGYNSSGVYTIWPRLLKSPLKVYCDMDTDGGGWTMIQRRGPFSKKVDFFRNWRDYKYGFGNIEEEFWIGNENIYALTNQKTYFARFDMQTVDKVSRYATYSSFRIENESSGYRLRYGDFTGTAGNGLRHEKNTKFSAKDRKNDNNAKLDCSAERKGGWWYDECGYSNPNGLYLQGGMKDHCEWQCMNWYPLTSQASLLAIDIKLRPKTN